MSSPRLQDYSRLVAYPVQKKLLSLLDGYHRGEGAGSSHEFLDMAEYRYGDDISDIDWKGTARRGQPVVKRFESTAVLSVIVASDTGASMAALAEDGSAKNLVAAELVRALSWLVSAHGDLLGLVAGSAGGVRSMPARAGVGHAETLLRVASSATVSSGQSDLPALLRHVELGRRRSLVFVISDDSQISDVTAALLRRLTSRHQVGLFLIEDLDPTRPGDAKLGAKARAKQDPTKLVDVTAGPLPAFVEGNQVIEAQWRMFRKIRRQEVDRRLEALPLTYRRVGGMDDVLPALVDVVGGGKRAA